MFLCLFRSSSRLCRCDNCIFIPIVTLIVFIDFHRISCVVLAVNKVHQKWCASATYVSECTCIFHGYKNAIIRYNRFNIESNTTAARKTAANTKWKERRTILMANAVRMFLSRRIQTISIRSIEQNRQWQSQQSHRSTQSDDDEKRWSEFRINYLSKWNSVVRSIASRAQWNRCNS